MSAQLANVLIFLTCLQAARSAQPELKGVQATATDPWFNSHRAELLELYMNLHTHPELSYREVETAARLATELRRAGAR